MTEQYRFFDSIDGEDERYYTADEFAEYFRQFIRNGVFNGSGDNLQVGTEGVDMKTHILPGYAWIEGYLYKVVAEPLELHHQSADASYNRMDRVVLRLDKTLEHRYVKAFVLTGEPAETPEVPALTRQENVYELALAQVEIIAGKSFIEPYQITDERLNSDVCGIATHLFEQIDTSEMFEQLHAQWQSWFETLQAGSYLAKSQIQDLIEDKALSPEEVDGGGNLTKTAVVYATGNRRSRTC